MIQITRILNTLFEIKELKILCTTVEDNVLIIDFSYYSEIAIAVLYNRLSGGHLSLNSHINAGQLTYALTPEVPQNKKPFEAFAYPE
jgi:hypothetical protein